MRKLWAIYAIGVFVATMIAIAYKAGQPRQEFPSPEAQMGDTLLIDHSRIPEDSLETEFYKAY